MIPCWVWGMVGCLIVLVSSILLVLGAAGILGARDRRQDPPPWEQDGQWP